MEKSRGGKGLERDCHRHLRIDANREWLRMPKDPAPVSQEAHHEAFSLPLFTFTMLASLAGLAALLRLAAPGFWTGQFLSTWERAAVAFVVVSLANGFVEFFFHRYVLHTSAVPFLRRLYRQHTLHHALTRIGRRKSRDGRGVLCIENKFPIVEAEQGEASFFPWYSMAVFAALATPALALMQWLLPSFPWFLSGYLALAVSLSLYEVLHAINHWPFEVWDPLIAHPRWGWFWRPVYAFHLRHHAVIDCNESISGFFGLPVADWVFGTCVIPRTVYADGEEWSQDKFRSPQPVWIIRQLDSLARNSVRTRRDAASSGAEVPVRALTRGERIAAWISHGAGLATAVAGLTLMIVFACLRGSAWHVVSFTVFGVTLLTLSSVSALYHARRSEEAKLRLRRLGQAGAILLIAGTFTPILLTTLRGPWGWSLFGVIWGLCGLGAALHLMFGERARVTSGLASLLVAWLLVLVPLLTAVPAGALWLLAAGGLCYLTGVAFYRLRRLPYRQALWQGLAAGGSVCHVLAMLLFVLPHAA